MIQRSFLIVRSILSIVLVCAVFVVPRLAHAEANAGFVDASIWFSNEPDGVGESTTISSLVNNQDTKAIYGIVSFYDNGTSVGSKVITVEAHASKVVTVPWKVTEGTHTLIVKFEKTRYINDKGTATIVLNAETSPYRFTVTAPVPNSNPNSKTTTTAPANSKIDAKTSEIKNTVEDVATNVKDAATNTFAKFDAYRAETGKVLGVKAVAAVQNVDKVKKEQAAAPKAQKSFVATPFAYLKMFILKIAHFIFSTVYTFYGLIVLSIILFVRYLIRAPR